MKYALFILICIFYAVLSCSGLYLLKSTVEWWSMRFLFGVILYATGAFVWLLILKMYPLSFAFPIATGVLMVGTTLIGIMLLDEKISLFHMLGMVFIIFGISCLLLGVK